MVAKAKFRIEGEDATAAAFRSALGNATNTAEKMRRQFATAFSGLVGFSAIQGLRKIIRINTEESEEFAKSVTGVKDAFRDLFTFGPEGLSQINEQLAKMTDALTDPAVQEGARKLVGGLVLVGGKIIEGWALLAGEIANVAESLRNANPELERAYKEQERLSLAIGSTYERMQEMRAAGSEGSRNYEKLAGSLSLYRKELEGVQRDIVQFSPLEEVSVGAKKVGTPGAAAQDEITNVIVTAQRTRRDALQDYYDAVEDRSRTAAEKEADEYFGMMADIEIAREEGLLLDEEYHKRRLYWQQYYDEAQLAEVKVTAEKVGSVAAESMESLSEYALQAARNMQDAFADFLFDPFEDGLKGMLKGFIDTIRRMVAEAAAAKIFDSKASGGFGLGDLVGAGIGSAFGGFRASGGPIEQGKWYVAGEKGPEPIWGGGAGAFATGYGRSGSVTVAPVYNIDARGATQDLIKALPAILEANTRRAIDMARARFADDLSRGAMR